MRKYKPKPMRWNKVLGSWSMQKHVIDIAHLRISVHHCIDMNHKLWFVSCEQTGTHCHQLKSAKVVDAKREALHVISAHIEVAYSMFEMIGTITS